MVELWSDVAVSTGSSDWSTILSGVCHIRRNVIAMPTICNVDFLFSQTQVMIYRTFWRLTNWLGHGHHKFVNLAIYSWYGSVTLLICMSWPQCSVGGGGVNLTCPVYKGVMVSLFCYNLYIDILRYWDATYIIVLQICNLEANLKKWFP